MGSEHENRIVRDLAFGASTGAMLVVGDAPRGVVSAAGAAASLVVTVGGDPAKAEDWQDLLPPPVLALDSLEELPEGEFGAAVLWEPAAGAGETLELILRRLADGASLHVVQRVVDRGVGNRWRRLLEASCEPGVVTHQREDGWWFVSGTRRAPSPDDREMEVESIPCSVIVLGSADMGELERTLVDVLLRPTYPGAEAFVVDLSGRAPEDLWGFPAASQTETVLVDAAGHAMAETVNDVLGGVRSELVAVVRGGERCAPNHLAGLAMLLEGHPAAAAAVCAGTHVPGHPVAPLFRREALRALQGLDPGAGEHGMTDLWSRLSVRHEVVAHPVTLALPGD